MAADFRLETARLVLRGWNDDDLEPFARLCADPEVMRYLGPQMSRNEAAAAIARQQAVQRDKGHCFWVMERKQDGAFLGFCGLKMGQIDTPIEGLIEIGWRMYQEFWGRGYAREAAQASLAWGFRTLGADAIWAITVPANSRSWGLMERLGMTRRHDLDFDFPGLAPDDPLLRSITYSIERPS